MSTTAVTSERVQITFGETPLAVEALRHRGLDDKIVCRNGSQELLLRLPKRPSDPVFLRAVTLVEEADDEVVFAVADETEEYAATCWVRAGAHGLHFRMAVVGPEPVWLAEWTLRGLALEEIIVPALGGQALSGAMPAGTRAAYKYPFWWNAQFVLGAVTEAGGLWLRTMEAQPRFKLLRVEKEAAGTFALTLGFEAMAPLGVETLDAEWYLDAYDGGWRQPVDVHRAWLAETFGLVPFAAHPYFPAWARDVDFVLELWGMRKDRGLPAHTFAAMAARIEAFAALHPPARTLLYLPGFAEGGIDSNIPDYRPAPRLGGREGFRRLVDRAHALGYPVMIHTNVLGMAYTHPRYAAFAAHQVVDVFDRPQGWAMDVDGDWLAEPYFAYINPGVPAWGDLMEAVLGELITAFGLDAVFLDQTLLAFNVSRGPNFLDGMRAHIERLQQAFPDVLFAGEGLNELVQPALPLVQIHGIDSIAGVQAPGEGVPGRRVHPVSTYLFGRHTRFMAHLLTRHPSDPVFARQEAAYAALGVLPALVCYDAAQPLDAPAVRRMLARAGRGAIET